AASNDSSNGKVKVTVKNKKNKMKSFTLVTLLACALVQASLGAAIAGEEATADVDLGTALKMFYTSLQRIMPCGSAELGVPVLAPYKLDLLPLNVENENYNVSGLISNLEVTGLNDFRILASNFDAATNRTYLDVIHSQIQVLAKYNVSARVNVAGFPLQPSGNGLLNVKIQDYRTVADWVIAPSSKNPNGVEVTDANIRFYLGNVLNNNWNNEWDIAVNNFINNFVNEAVLLWAQEVQKRIDGIYSQMYLPMINESLQNVSLKDMIDFLMFQAAQYDNVECNAN
ncbi:hypothetical protein DOY81_005984, partial [Sarcophaga bullata]